MIAKAQLGSLLREAIVLLAFCVLTAVLTWPYINCVRDCVVDKGDPYLVSWIMWWDYHQTFTNPLQLFQANIFYPYSYSLAFSEHMFGISLVFFPLFALGLPPLTVHGVAMFVGFAICGYGAFRLGRTVSGSDTVAWVSGIIFAFTPFRFDQMSQLPYLFTPWLPLSLEALILFARETSWRRATWFGATFFFLGLSSVTWLTFFLWPLGLSTVVLAIRYGLWRQRRFWWRGCSTFIAASFGLLPFMIPYYVVARLYGFTRSIEDVKDHSASPIHWLSINPRNILWSRIGPVLVPNSRFRLFPGLLTPVLSALAIAARGKAGNPETKSGLGLTATRGRSPGGLAKNRWLVCIDTLICLSFLASVLTVSFEVIRPFGGLFNYLKSEIALTSLAVAIVARLLLAYPAFMRLKHANLVEALTRLPDDALWLGMLLTVLGFLYSLGWNFFFYRFSYEVIPLFRAIRAPTRGAMYAYLGLSVLAGLGVKRLAEILNESRLHLNRLAVVSVFCGLLLFESSAAPLTLIHGELLPDPVTVRLKQTPMRGGIVMLPVGGGYNHTHVLRAADHGKPLITATSGFTPPYEIEIENLTNSGPITSDFLDVLEKIPASYVVVLTHLVQPERKAIYENFFSRAVASGRLRFINRFSAHDDLYAVTRTEPETISESGLPFPVPQREWSAAIKEDPINLMSHSLEWTRTVYCMYLAAFGRMPRYTEFITDMNSLSRGVIIGATESEPALPARLLRLAELLEQRDEFRSSFGRTSDEEFVAKLLTNASLQVPESEGLSLITSLQTSRENRASMLAKFSVDSRVLQQEQNRFLVLIYYFAYLRRSPDDPPDHNLDGYEFWLKHLEKNGRGELTTAFATSTERVALVEREHQ